jgi:methionyl aminopeptidase
MSQATDNGPQLKLPCARCDEPATLQCPRCLELKLEKDLAAFCSQECFKAAWADHKQLHKPSTEGWHYCTRRGQGRSLNRPDFHWTGALRPHRIGPMRPVGSSSLSFLQHLEFCLYFLYLFFLLYTFACL